MSTLKSRLQSLRHRAIGAGNYFVPEGSLQGHITYSDIQSLVIGCGIEDFRQQEIVDSVLLKARKIFAILVLMDRVVLIADFIKADQLLNQELDSKLPFSIDNLQKIIPQDDVQDFYEKQWEFVAPLFSKEKGHRLLDVDTILPFAKDDQRDEGGFGWIFHTKIHSRHVQSPEVQGEKYSDGFVEIVRKQLKQMNSQGREKFKNEQRVLTFLNRLKHPNILGLLGSYTYNDTNNFLFPKADKDLETLITQPLPQKDFQSDGDYYITLARLSWAIEKMHDYSSNGLELEFIGCHHDLKPDNIFVVRGQFILADFGLATLKPATETSKSLFKQGAADYLAPECVDEKAGFRALEISRPSDIWSFGCIIAQIITYITRGCEGVIQFREKRKVLRAGYLTEYCFHEGLSRNPGVQVWLDELAIEAPEDKILLLHLVQDMLDIDPACRPLAKEVTTRLRVIAVKATFHSVITLYDTLLASELDLEIRIEFERCRLWGWAAGLISITDNCNYSKGIYETDVAFDRPIATLHDIKNELRSIIAMTRPNEALYPVFLRLRVLNDELCANLDRAMQSRMRMLLNIRMLDTEDPSRLKETCDLFEESLNHHSLSVLAAIKYASTLAKEYSEDSPRNLLLNPFSIQKISNVGTQELSWFSPEADSANRVPVLVEHRLIDAHWSGIAGRRLFDRVSKLAELLHSTPSPSRRSLRCLGFFCDNSRLAFSLVYAIPSSPSCTASDLCPLTFKDVIDKTADTRLRPVLDARYSLAHELAVTILYYHQVGWLHKNISAQTVLFFLPPSTALSAAIAAPYLVGFNHSRPSGPAEYTEGLPALRDYQHPEYQNHSDSRYRHEYDYYSLGIVLTEIGLWKSLASMTRKKETQKLPPEDFRRYLLKEWVPLLGYYMGQRYHDVVVACIKGQFGGDETNGAIVPLEFETKVVQELAICAKSNQ